MANEVQKDKCMRFRVHVLKEVYETEEIYLKKLDFVVQVSFVRNFIVLCMQMHRQRITWKERHLVEFNTFIILSIPYFAFLVIFYCVEWLAEI